MHSNAARQGLGDKEALLIEKIKLLNRLGVRQLNKVMEPINVSMLIPFRSGLM